MFGIVCAGRQMELSEQIDNRQFVKTIINAENVNHLVVFVIPPNELDPNVAASVYFQLPGSDFQLLGALTRDKPSAIFKLNHSKSKYVAPSSADLDAMDEDDVNNPLYGGYKINVGISLEPLAEVQNQLEQVRVQQEQTSTTSARPSASSLPPDSIALLANKIVQNAYNFLSGFTGADGKVPMRVFDDWWNKFRSRLSSDPRFLESLCNN